MCSFKNLCGWAGRFDQLGIISETQWSLSVRFFSFSWCRPAVSGSHLTELTALWIRGIGAGLSWKIPQKMEKASTNTWMTTLEYMVDHNSVLCASPNHCLFTQTALEFRIYTDQSGTEDMIGPNFYFPLPMYNSLSGSAEFKAPNLTVYPTFEAGGIEKSLILPSNMFIPDFIRQCKCLSYKYQSILLPPTFYTNGLKKYPLVVVLGNSGKIVIKPLLKHMYNESAIEEAIIVHLSIKDMCKYSPYSVNTVWKCKGASDCHKDCQWCWAPDRDDKCIPDEFRTLAKKCLSATRCYSIGEQLLEYIEHYLIHHIQVKVSYRAQLNAPQSRISIIGHGYAGLLACYAAITRPHLFGNAGCLSPKLYAPLDGLTSHRIGLSWTVSNQLALHPERKGLYNSQLYYIDFGENDDFEFPLNDPSVATESLVGLMKDKLGLEESKNIILAVVPNESNGIYRKRGETNENLLQRLRFPLQLFLKPQGGTREHPRIQAVADKLQMEEKTMVLKSNHERNTSTDEATFKSCPQGLVPLPVAGATLGRHPFWVEGLKH